MGSFVSPTDDEKGMPSSDISMLDANGSGSSSGGPMDSPTSEFPGRSISPGAIGNPSNAVGSFPTGNVMDSPTDNDGK